MSDISPLALIDPAARLGPGVRVEAFSVVHGNVVLGEGCHIGSHCTIGHPAVRSGQAPLELGPGARVRSHAVLYEGSTIGPGLETGHHVVIREGSEIGENLRIGNYSDIEGACRIGDFCRLHGYVHVGRGTTIGDFAWLFSLTTMMNDPLPPSHIHEPVHIGHLVTICVNAQCMPGTRIGDGAFLSAGALARGTVPPATVIGGPDGRPMGPVTMVMHMGQRLRHPWPRHFADAYPERARERLQALSTAAEEAARAMRQRAT